jgi:hypothetical protein
MLCSSVDRFFTLTSIAGVKFQTEVRLETVGDVAGVLECVTWVKRQRIIGGYDGQGV